MGEAVEQCRCHFGVAKDRGPFAEAEVGGDDDAGPLIELAQQMDGGGSGNSPVDCFPDDTAPRQRR